LKVTALPRRRSKTATFEDVEEASTWFSEALSRRTSLQQVAGAVALMFDIISDTIVFVENTCKFYSFSLPCEYPR